MINVNVDKEFLYLSTSPSATVTTATATITTTSYKYTLLCLRGTQTCALAVANIAHAVREMLDVAKRPIPQG